MNFYTKIFIKISKEERSEDFTADRETEEKPQTVFFCV